MGSASALRSVRRGYPDGGTMVGAGQPQPLPPLATSGRGQVKYPTLRKQSLTETHIICWAESPKIDPD